MKRWIPATILLLIALPSCGQTPTEFRPLPSALGDQRGVALGFNGLLPLEQGIYSVWANLDDGDVVGLGGFHIDDAGLPVDSEGVHIDRFVAERNLFNSVSLLIAAEPTSQIGSSPSQAVILQGPVADGIANLSVPAPLFIADAAGSYRVFTPTDGPATNEGSGLWAVSVAGEPTLSLPPLNTVYRYEHYVVINGVPVTMGRFEADDKPDFLNPWSGSLPAPQFPGEDFLMNAPSGVTFPANLGGARLLVTLEPTFNDTVDPSQLVVLEGFLPATVTGGEVIQLVNRTADFPSGTAVIF